MQEAASDGQLWLALAAAPFILRLLLETPRAIRAAVEGKFVPLRFLDAVFVYGAVMCACIALVVVATRVHFALGVLACIALSFASHIVLTGEVQHAAGSRGTFMNRFLLFGIAGAVVASQYANRTRERAIETARLSARLADAKLRALRMQLHPHFLFNTLNTIAGLFDDDPGGARLMTERLERFLDMSLRPRDAQEVVLRDELRFVMTYLEIQRARFGDRLRVSLDADDAVLDALVPPLVLQPLVENAIRHGIGPRKSGGTVAVRATSSDDRLALTVEDDGEGAAVESLAPGVGLSNTRARLRQLYGARQKVMIRSMPERGFTVELELPLRFAHA